MATIEQIKTLTTSYDYLANFLPFFKSSNAGINSKNTKKNRSRKVKKVTVEDGLSIKDLKQRLQKKKTELKAEATERRFRYSKKNKEDPENEAETEEMKVKKKIKKAKAKAPKKDGKVFKRKSKKAKHTLKIQNKKKSTRKQTK